MVIMIIIMGNYGYNHGYNNGYNDGYNDYNIPIFHGIYPLVNCPRKRTGKIHHDVAGQINYFNGHFQ